MLTDEQRRIVEENHNLIYSFINMHHLDESEYYGALAIALCKAVAHYNKNNGSTFGTYAFQCFDNTCKAIYRMSNTLKRIPKNELIYLSDYVFVGDDGEEHEIEIADPKNLYEEYENAEDYEEFKSKFLTDIQAEVFDMVMKGFTFTEIANIRNVTPQCISDMVQRITKHWQKFRKEDNI